MIGGGGAVRAMMDSIKMNSRRKKIETYYEKDMNYTNRNKPIKTIFAKPEVLDEIRQKMKRQKRIELIVAISLVIILTSLIFIIF